MNTIDKIMAEIEQFVGVSIHDVEVIAKNDVLQIIDKYAEQEPCRVKNELNLELNELKPCDDAISRRAVLDGIEELKQSPWATDKRGNGFEYLITEALDMVADLCVKQEPSVRPQEPTGHWEEIVKEHKCYARDDTYTTTEYHCSECGEEPFVNEDGFYELSNYCPNCGANMRKESHD